MNCTVWRWGRPCRSTALNTALPGCCWAWGVGASAGTPAWAAAAPAGAAALVGPAAAAIATWGAIPYFGRTTPVTEPGEYVVSLTLDCPVLPAIVWMPAA